MHPSLPLHLLDDFSDDAAIPIGLPIDTAAHGPELICGASLAIARHHQFGGLPVRAIWCDDHRSADGGRAAALHLTRLGIRAVVGHFSSRAALAAAPVYAANDALFIAPGSSAPELTATSCQTVFRLFGRDDDQAAAIAEFLRDIAAAQTIDILAEDNAYGRSVGNLVAARLARHGIASVVSVVRDDDAHSAKANGSVVLAGRHEFSARLLRRLSPARIRVVTDDALTPAFIDEAGDAAEGIMIPVIAPAARSDDVDRLNDRYVRLCDAPPGGYFLTSYVAVDLVLRVLRDLGDAGGAQIAVHLRSHRWPTLIGELSFACSGEVDGLTWRMVRVTNGHFVRT